MRTTAHTHLALAASLLVAGSFCMAGSAVAGDWLCKLKKTSSYKDTTIACYSEPGCERSAALGGEPIRDFDQTSAPFALARGKISAIVSDSKALIAEAEKAGASCAAIGE